MVTAVGDLCPPPLLAAKVLNTVTPSLQMRLYLEIELWGMSWRLMRA